MTSSSDTPTLRDRLQEHLAALRQTGQPLDLGAISLPGADLQQMDLSHVRMPGANLQAANLSGANLQAADLSGANLRQATLKRTRLLEANLSQADLSGCDLSTAMTSAACFTQANLEGANLRSHWFQKNDFRQARLHRADLRDVQGETSDFTAADLTAANLAGASLPGCCFANARFAAAELRAVRLEGADLHAADLRSVDLSRARLRDADLTDADLSAADLRDADLRTERAAGARFKDAISDEHTLWPAGHDPHAAATIARPALALRWQAAAPREQDNFLAFDGPIDELALAPDQRRIVCASNDRRQVLVFDYASGSRLQALDLQTGGDPVAGLAVTADSSFALVAVNSVAGGQNALRYVALDETALLPEGVAQPTPPEIAWIESLRIAPNGRFVLLSNPYSIEVYDHLKMRPAYFLRMQGLASERQPLLQPPLISADSRRAFAAAGSLLAAWDIPSRDLLQQIDAGAPVTALALLATPSSALDSAGDLLLAGHPDGSLSVWDWQRGQRLALIPGAQRGPLSALAVTPDGRCLLTGGAEDGAIYAWEIERPGDEEPSPGLSLRRARTLAGHAHCVRRLLTSADSQYALSSGSDGSLRRWRIADGKQIAQALPPRAPGIPAACDPSGRWIIAAHGHEGRSLAVWEAESGKLRHALRGHQGDVAALACLADGRLLSAANDHLLLLWDIEQGKRLHAFASLRAPALALCVLPGQERLLVIARDGRLHAWELRGQLAGDKPAAKTLRFNAPLRWADAAAAFSPDGRHAIVYLQPASERAAARQPSALPPSAAPFDPSATRPQPALLDLAGGAPPLRLPPAPPPDDHAQLSAINDQRSAVSFQPPLDDPDGVFSPFSGQLSAVSFQPSAGAPVFPGAFSPTGRYLAWPLAAGGLQLYDLTGPVAPAAARSVEPAPAAETIDPAATHPAQSGAAAEARAIAEAGTAAEARTIARRPTLLALESGNSLRYSLLAFTPDERFLVAASQPNRLAVFDLSSGRSVGGYAGHTRLPCALALHPSGRLAASADPTGDLHTWELPTGRLLAAQRLDQPARWLAFTPGGDALLAGGDGGWMAYFETLEQ